MSRRRCNMGDSPDATISDKVRGLVTVTASDTFLVATEEELYAEVARAWYRMHSAGGHVKRPIRPYVIGPDFVSAPLSLIGRDARVEQCKSYLLTTCGRVAAALAPGQSRL